MLTAVYEVIAITPSYDPVSAPGTRVILCPVGEDGPRLVVYSNEPQPPRIGQIYSFVLRGLD